jgi:preprotein translocase subunit SecF
LSFIFAGLIAMLISFVQYKAPLKPGLDFTGGTRLQFELHCFKPGNCDKLIELTTVREILRRYQLADSSIQLIGAKQKRVLIRTKPLKPDKRIQIQNALSQKLGAFNT